MISYSTDVSGLTEADLAGFFVGWPTAPSPAQHLAVLRGSYRVVLALSGAEVAGFVHMISDGVLTAFVPWLEVRPSFQGQGIGTELMRRIVAEAAHMYSVDLICDEDLRPFYERLGMTALTGMVLRNRSAL
ncbi:GNAT family N-acetyltransferase [Lentzea sp. NBRC 102530]|uniref:GNAT family N-acetyltransferase n=1 Tax=Lentzea sp. NBRC 102530 TaxID=3032201 RepID=UPI0024A014BA|nr:GNAT family N-acetyltransferase [Lentzea sp. NBRC 102530]GLY46739.1 N-acetyltransferase [Lentzea sp. NBRC 102530]